MAAPMKKVLRNVIPKLSHERGNFIFLPPRFILQRSNDYTATRDVQDFHCKAHLHARGMCTEAPKVEAMSTNEPFLFDTHSMVKSFEVEGFTTPQAEVMVLALVRMSQSNLQHINKNMVSKPQQDLMHQQIMTHLSSIKKDMIILEKGEFSAIRHEYEKQQLEITQMRQHFEDEVTKLKSGVTLDLNLEKSRAKEAHAENIKSLGDLKNRMEIERTQGQRDLSMIDNKIDREIANLLATYERYRNDVLKYAAGTVMTCLTLCLGFLRLWA